MSVATTSQDVKAPDTFVSLSTELSKAGWGFTEGSKNAIQAIAQRGIALTQVATVVSPEEVAFYKALNGKVSSTQDTVELLDREIDVIGMDPKVKDFQENAPKFRADFLTKTETQRYDFLIGDSCKSTRAVAADTVRRLKLTEARILPLIYTTSKGLKETPFKDLASFVEYRNKVISVFNKAVGVQNQVAALGNSLSADSLYQSVADYQKHNTRLARTKRAISNHPYLTASVPALGILGTAGYLAYKHFSA